MTPQLSDLRGAQPVAAEAIAEGATPVEAARRAGVSERTAYRWLARPAFAGAIREARRSRLQAITAALDAGAREGVDLLRAVVGDPEAYVMARVRAALGLIDARLRYAEAVDVEARLEALETAAKSAGKVGR